MARGRWRALGVATTMGAVGHGDNHQLVWDSVNLKTVRARIALALANDIIPVQELYETYL